MIAAIVILVALVVLVATDPNEGHDSPPDDEGAQADLVSRQVPSPW